MLGSAPSAGSGGRPLDDAVLSRWLESTLRTERAKLAKNLYRNVNVQLEEHHKAVLEALSEKLNEVLLKPSGNATGADMSEISVGHLSVPADLEAVAPHAEAATVTPPQSQAFAAEPSKSPVKKHYKSRALCELAGQSYNDHDDGHRSCFENFVRGNKFDVLSATAILGCAISMIFEIQYAGFDSGHALQPEMFDRPADEVWPGAAGVFIQLNRAWNAIFLIELVVRLVVMKWESLTCGWTWFDVILISLGYLDMFGLLKLGVNPTMLRVVRLARVMRLLKVVKAVRSFQTLFLLVRSLQASIGALLWSFMLLCSAQMVSSIFMCQMLRETINDEDADEALRKQLFALFGTFENAMITMFEITLSNWVPACRLMVDQVAVAYGMFILVYRGCFMFALIKVITAVFLAETTRCANSDDNIAVQKRQKSKAVYCMKLTEIFEELDSTGDGFLSLEEFMPLITDDLLTTWLTTLEIDTYDLAHLFQILDTGDNKIDIQEFTAGMSRVRGPAKSIDVLRLQTVTSEMSSVLERVMHCVGARLPPVPDQAQDDEECERDAEDKRGVLELTELVLALASDMDARQRQQDAKLDVLLCSKACPGPFSGAIKGANVAADFLAVAPALDAEPLPKDVATARDPSESRHSRGRERRTEARTEAQSSSREGRAEVCLEGSPSPSRLAL